MNVLNLCTVFLENCHQISHVLFLFSSWPLKWILQEILVVLDSGFDYWFQKWYQSEKASVSKVIPVWKARVSKAIPVWKGKGFESDTSLKRQGLRKWYQSEKARVSKVIPVWKGKGFESILDKSVLHVNLHTLDIPTESVYQFQRLFCTWDRDIFRVISIDICSCEALLSISPFEIW